MSYSIIGSILLATIALSSANFGSINNNERNVLARFYSDFAQLYRSAPLKSYVDDDKTMELYQFFFTEKDYVQMIEESLTMLYTNVFERTVTYHPMPNFEQVGARYVYRRDPKQEFPVEIELVNSEDRLFREVRFPNRYFYLTSFENIEYVNDMPVTPYYEVSFICNSSLSRNTETQTPVLSYLDKSLQYTPRYLLDMPSFDSNKTLEMCAYADIRNNGEQSIVIKGAELIAGDISLNPKYEAVRTSYSYAPMMAATQFSYNSESIVTRPLGEQASGTYVFQLSIPSSIKIAPHSVKSVEFFRTNLTVESFAYYSSVFSPINSRGKLLNAYNLTSLDNFLPNGRLILRQQGRFLGQIDLPNLSINQTYMMTFGFDSDITYRRQVKILDGNETSEIMKYDVEYVFESFKPSRDIQVYFTESFSSLKYFQIDNISKLNDNNNYPEIVAYGSDLRGSIFLPRPNGQKTFSFQLTVFKSKPIDHLF